MNAGPGVIVNKGGFLAALAKGLFGTIIVIVICGTALGVYGMRIVDHHATSVTELVASAWPEWQKALPPCLADAVNDRRAPEYRQALDVAARVATVGEYDDDRVLVVEITNNGTEVVSLLGLHVVLEDERGVPVRDWQLLAATPLMLDHDWRGPLQPGSTRRIVERVRRATAGDLKAAVETTELRIWNRPTGAPAGPTPTPEEGLADAEADS